MTFEIPKNIFYNIVIQLRGRNHLKIQVLYDNEKFNSVDLDTLKFKIKDWYNY